MALTVEKVFTYETFDAYGIPALEGHMILNTGEHVSTTVPTMIYGNRHCAQSIVDNDQSRYEGRGLTKLVQYVNSTLGHQLKGVSPQRQIELDAWLVSLDPDARKSRIGAQIMLVISQLLAKAAALEREMPLHAYLSTVYRTIQKNPPAERKQIAPLPCISHIIGGRSKDQRAIDFAAVTSVPVSSWQYDYALHKSIELTNTIKQRQRTEGIVFSTDVYGQFLPQYTLNKKAIALVNESIGKIGLRAGMDMFCGLNVCAHDIISNHMYPIKDSQSVVTRNEYTSYLANLIETHSIIMMYDPLDYDDWEGWKSLTRQCGDRTYINASYMVGGSPDRMKKIVDDHICSMITINPLQVGTITESFKLINQAQQHSLSIGISTLPNETSDTFLADFTVAVNADYALFGPFSDNGHVDKYMRLLHVQQHIGKTQT